MDRHVFTEPFLMHSVLKISQISTKESPDIEHGRQWTCGSKDHTSYICQYCEPRALGFLPMAAEEEKDLSLERPL